MTSADFECGDEVVYEAIDGAQEPGIVTGSNPSHVFVCYDNFDGTAEATDPRYLSLASECPLCGLTRSHEHQL